MECYYEILEVPKNAEEVQIRKGFKALALKWHPDKNFNNANACTKQFQKLQKAYSVLSDPIKRQLYDDGEEDAVIVNNYDNMENYWDTNKLTCDHSKYNHRRFDYPQKFNRKLENINIKHYFNTRSWFKGYTDKPDGFYTICRKIFEKLSLEVDHPHVCPTFGWSESDYKTVVEPFYDYWTYFYPNEDNYLNGLEWIDRIMEVRHFVDYIKTIDERVHRFMELRRMKWEMEYIYRFNLQNKYY